VVHLVALLEAAQDGDRVLDRGLLDEDRLAGLNMGLLLGVARGSAERPRMVVLRYEPARPATGAILATFMIKESMGCW
jgi:leucyl aminopeptidase